MEPDRRSARSAAARTLLGVLVVGLVALLAGSSVTAGADLTAARDRRAAVRAQQAQVAAQVDVLQGSSASVVAALAALDENVRGQQAAMVEARRQADASRLEAEKAEADAAETGRQLDRLRARMTDYAVAAYVSPPDEQLFRQFEAASAQQDADRRAFLDLRSGNDMDLIDQLRATKRRLEEQLDRARRARATAEAQLAAADAALGSLTEARAAQQRVAEQVRIRLDERLSDAQYLARLDASFAAQITAEESKLIDAVSNVPVTPPGGGSGGSGSGGGSGGSGSGGSGTGGPPVTAPPITPAPGLVTVGGITVAASIGEQLRQLLAAASAAGINLGGYGYRDNAMQIQLRRQNCGTSDYAIWYMPADACRPPTARPGSSMHERGLAIDFQANGSFINSHSNPGFIWLAANAGRFGFSNLPSEPWHWSVTGF